MRSACVVLTLAATIAGTGCDRPAPTAPAPAAQAAAEPLAGVSGSPTVKTPDSLSGVTLVDITAGSTGTSNNYVGQSVTIPGHAAYHGIRFNWYTYGQNPSPTAFGTLYLLDAEYLGAPDNLSASTPGFVAASESIVNGQYVFDPKVKIKGGGKYWFYTSAQGAFATGFYSDTYAGGDMYVTGMPALVFHLAFGAPGVVIDANFRLQVRVTD